MLNAVYNLSETGKFIPYLTAGLAGDYTEQKLLMGPDVGIGARIYLTESIMLRPEVRYVHLFTGREDLVVTLGLTFAFGSEAPAAPREEPAPTPTPTPAPAPAPAPAAPGADSDKDGIADSADTCADTPTGVAVDASGCPVDSDGDGVADHLDACAGTASGISVDQKGCPVDSDVDGVPDYQDKCPGTPGNSRVDAEGCVLSITLKVTFDTGRAVVKSEFMPEVEKFAEFLKQNPELKAEIQGHTDNLGNPKNNQELSEARAQAVREVLVERYGVSADRLTAKGYGQDNPVTGNDTREGREKNRRVEAVIVK